MNLQLKYFDYIKNGTKRIGLRLFDEKRRRIRLGDIIEFINPDGEMLAVKVVGLLRYEPFEELFRDFDIAMLRRMRGLTQVYMAEKLGVARQTYINIEKGLKELTLSQVRILEEELQVTFEDLLGIDTGGGDLAYRKYLK